MAEQEVKTGITSGPTKYPAYPRQAIFEASETQKFDIGARYVAKDGRVFRYARAGAVALAAGELQTSPAFGGSSATIQSDMTVVLAIIGARTVFITTKTDATTINQFADGYLAVSDGTGQGEMYKIIANAAGSAGSLRFDLDRGLSTAWVAANTKVSIMTNPYNLIVQSPVTTAIGLPLGVPMVAIPIKYYGWIQTWGMACVLVGVPMDAFAADVLIDLSEAGSATIDNGTLINATIGMTGMATADEDSGLIFLKISP